jgi:hypothetical protein
MSDEKADDLTQPGERRRKHRAPRKKRAFLWITLLVLVVAAAIGARPGYHWLKARRAEQFAAEGGELFKQSKWNEAAEKYRAALQLDPLGYSGLEGAARLASRADRPEAADLWEQVMKLPQCTDADRQEYAALLIKLRRLERAGKIIDQLLKANPDTKTLILASRYAEQAGESGKALEFARAAMNRAQDNDAARSRLAELLAASSDSTQQAEARQILWELAGKEGPYKRIALQVLARAPELSADEQTRILRSLEGLPSPSVEDVLLAADFRIKLHLGEADHIYDETITRFGKGDTATLLQLAQWLNAHRQPERVLALLPTERATENNQLIMMHLDALAILQRWSDIDKLLARSDLTFDPAVLESFRARSSQGQNSATDAEFHWNRALSAAANDPFKLRFVANFAEQTHAAPFALKAYEQLARFPEHAAFAYHGIERVGGKTGGLTAQRAAAEKLLALNPTDPNSVAQLLYLDLLLGSEVEANLVKANDLVKKFPSRLAFRITAALGYLRQHDAGSALTQFSGPSNAPPIEWSKTPPSWRAVYAAALFANEQSDKAKEIIANIPEGSLNAEEKALIAPATEAK